jgi:hypothetical protein
MMQLIAEEQNQKVFFNARTYFDNRYGEQKWRLAIQKGENTPESTGELTGSTKELAKVYVPSSDEIIKIYLLVEDKEDSFSSYETYLDSDYR